MKENKIEQLPPEYVEYVKSNIGVPKYIDGQELFYRKNACHVNSILFSDFIYSKTKYNCSIIEGIVVRDDGFAYDHFWNLIRDDKGGTEYVDVTNDAIGTEKEKNAGKTYYEIKEYGIDELVEKIKNKEPLFSDEVKKALKNYYNEHPEKEEEYRKGKQAVEE